MKNLKGILLSACFVLSSSVFAYGIGYSSYPLSQKMKMVSAEATGILSDAKGVGIQGRYTQRLSRKTIVDGGVGISGGDRTTRLFVGADYEIFPDYRNQPRFSMKANLERAKEFEIARNNLSLSPTVSKGFSFWGREAYPFVALPVGLSLDGDSSTYKTQISAAMGISGKLPIEGYDHLSGNIETNIDLKNSYTAFFVGVSFPLGK